MTWRPVPQPACEPGCTCGTPVREYLTANERAMLWPDVPALGVEETAEWIERTDPAPAEPPPEPGHEKARPLKREPGGVSNQHTAESFGFRHVGDLDMRDVPRVGIIRRIRNATNRKASPWP